MDTITFNSGQLSYQLIPLFISDEDNKLVLSSCQYHKDTHTEESLSRLLRDIFYESKKIIPDIKYLGINTTVRKTPLIWIFTGNCKIRFIHKEHNIKYELEVRSRDLLIIYPETDTYWKYSFGNVCVLQMYE